MPLRRTLALLVALVTPVHAAAIRGHVTVPPVAAEAASFRPYAGRASSTPSPARVARGLVTDAVVYVDSLPAGAAPAAGGDPPQLEQRNQAFAPRVVVVPVGGTVTFPNFDPFYHNVFSVSPPRRFDLGKYARGHSRSVRFEHPGQVNVFCDIHSDMAAFILVVPATRWTRPASDGRFELPDLPPGRYRLRAWHPDFPATSFVVEVPGSGDATQDVGF